MDDLYDEDIYAWSQHQAAVLRGLRSRRDLPNELDLEHVAEEIEDVGNSQLSAVQSYLRLIFVHLMKAACSRSVEPQLHWRGEVVGFHLDLVSRFKESMRKDIDLDSICSGAFKQAAASLKDHGEEISPLLRLGCPFELDELVCQDIEPEALLSRVAAQVQKPEERP
jgi:Domain of unknown function DUF29